jgi:hypothetical protein
MLLLILPRSAANSSSEVETFVPTFVICRIGVRAGAPAIDFEIMRLGPDW